jgi:hypothetical protein
MSRGSSFSGEIGADYLELCDLFFIPCRIRIARTTATPMALIPNQIVHADWDHAGLKTITTTPMDTSAHTRTL